jgi:hypothetical protein
MAAPVVFFLPMFFLYTVDYIKMQVKEAPMTSITDGAVIIQTSAESAPSSGSMDNMAPGPCWLTWLASPL